MRQAICVWAIPLAFLAGAFSAHAQIEAKQAAAFEVRHSVVIEAPQSAVFEAMTGEISGWWDHTFSGDPVSLYIDTRPGGTFREIMNDDGDFVDHARVLSVQAPDKIIMDGALGFLGNASHLVFTLEVVPESEDRTRVNVLVSASGVFQPGWDTALLNVWQHFLGARLKPYVEAGCTPDAPCPAFEEDAAE